jgi:oligoribonuclease
MAQLAGNSVHVDRMFLNKHMPEVVSYLSYRIVDVSSIKELARRWYPKVGAGVADVTYWVACLLECR